ncbi:LpxI family protein [Actibacterium lipolyticum]|uniref:DUF1009 domain-containing protein n=1 Tax=Actibacterium lipolyticum TaxID=1524263 RepID=A0A238JWD2_9RHOB|nr:UDP-2,3-diacylglucosamine diphosphatase LpxI [Actibacterium lipolyticum]SMX34960.1 hypothetical protein COL8621_01578 [Actibacterium lipolyticum]
MTKTAIIAGTGVLPGILADRLDETNTPYVIAELEGFAMENPKGRPVERFIVERLALLFDRFDDLGVEQVIFAGAVSRPAIDPERIDPKTATLLPVLLPAFQQGDDALLRAVIALFEDAGFSVVGVDSVAPELVPGEGVLTTAQPSQDDKADADRAAKVVAGIGALDVGQGAVVAQGLCLAIETLPGTAAMLRWVAEVAKTCRANPNGAKGVFFKAPKPGQERRIDLPAIGPDTVVQADAADLAGIVIEAGGVMLLDPEATIAEANSRGLFIWARTP